MKEYVERDAALAKTCEYCIEANGGTCEHKCVDYCAIAQLPAADVVEVRHGRFEDSRFTDGAFYQERCTICGEWSYDYDGNYCPYCGARMGGKGDGE